MNILGFLSLNNILTSVDVVVTTTLVYACIILLRRTRSIFIFRGIAIFVGIYAIASYLDLKLTTSLFQSFFSFFIIILVIIFQKEIRRFFENFSIAFLNPFSLSTKTVDKETFDIIIDSVIYLAKKKIGAIIVIPGKQNIEGFLEGGYPVEGQISEPLILSIFDTRTPGHDGAMIIENEFVKKFGVHLPLAENFKKFGNLGTRHRASLGLSEVSDAFVIVVSEEKGTISIAQNGMLKAVDIEKLKIELNSFTNYLGGRLAKSPISAFIVSDTKDKILALAISIVLWLALVGFGK